MNGDPVTRHRLEIARAGLRGYEEWLTSEDPSSLIDPNTLSNLASAARWLIETLTGEDT